MLFHLALATTHIHTCVLYVAMYVRVCVCALCMHMYFFFFQKLHKPDKYKKGYEEFRCKSL